ncbi:MAG: type II toxin-antitoxin system PemK/MazF family toxin [Ruminococcus sp.]|nr:type II toxin-antitoxin system PemK/MazF family toxin [Ruminococcus sp.]
MKKQRTVIVNWGQIYLCNLGDSNGSVQSGVRPVLIVQNNIGNKNSTTTVVATITTALKKLNQPTHIVLDESCGLREKSMVMLEQITTIDINKSLVKYIGEIKDAKTLHRIKQGLLTELGLTRRLDLSRTGLILSLCPKCRSVFMGSPDNVVRRVDPFGSNKRLCEKCQLETGYEYIVFKKNLALGVVGCSDE